MTAPVPRFATWWGQLGRGRRAVVMVVAGLLLAGVVGDAYQGLAGSRPGGPPSSSFSTGSSGLRAWAELLDRTGHEVDRSRDDVPDLELASTDTVVLSDPGPLDQADAQDLARFVAGGGRLVLIGPSAAGVLQAVTGEPWVSSSGSGPLSRWLAVPETAGVVELSGDAGRRWSTGPAAVGVVGDRDGAPAVVVADVAAGRLVAVADAELVSNRRLAEADNAALALGIVGPPGGRVVFVEVVHGFGAGGLAALPPQVRWAGLGLLLALGVGVWAAAARFGPAEPAQRSLRPPRRDHVEALAADLDRVARTPADLVVGLVHPHDPSVDDLGAALAAGAAAAATQRARRGMAPPVPTDRPPPGASP